MNGRGIQERTNKLTDALFGKLLHGIFGATAIFSGPLLSWGFLLHRFPWEEPVTQTHWIVAVAVSSLTTVVGGWGCYKFFGALYALRRHTKNMEKETAQRGHGWAKG